MCAFFSFFGTQPGIEPGHPRTSTLYPKDPLVLVKYIP